MTYDFTQYPIFRGLNTTQVENFVAACNDEMHPTDDAFIAEGIAGDRVYFIYEGKVRIDIRASGGKSRLLAELTAPAVLGEMEFLTGKPRTATVTAISEVRALSMDFEVLRTRVSDGDPGTLKIIYNIATVVAHRLAAMDKQLSKIEEREPNQTGDLVAFHRKIFEDWNV